VCRQAVVCVHVNACARWCACKGERFERPRWHAGHTHTATHASRPLACHCSHQLVGASRCGCHNAPGTQQHPTVNTAHRTLTLADQIQGGRHGGARALHGPRSHSAEDQGPRGVMRMVPAHIGPGTSAPGRVSSRQAAPRHEHSRATTRRPAPTTTHSVVHTHTHRQGAVPQRQGVADVRHWCVLCCVLRVRPSAPPCSCALVIALHPTHHHRHHNRPCLPCLRCTHQISSRQRTTAAAAAHCPTPAPTHAATRVRAACAPVSGCCRQCRTQLHPPLHAPV
jgi:hypothetical protein